MLRIALAIFALLAVASGASAQTTRPLDIVGIKIGMKTDEVLAAIKSHDPKMKVRTTTLKGALHNSRDPVVTALNDRPYKLDANELEVVLSPGPGPSIALYVGRMVDIVPSKAGREAVRKALLDKYGSPTSEEAFGTDLHMRWSFNVDTGRSDPWYVPTKAQVARGYNAFSVFDAVCNFQFMTSANRYIEAVTDSPELKIQERAYRCGAYIQATISERSLEVRTADGRVIAKEIHQFKKYLANLPRPPPPKL